MLPNAANAFIDPVKLTGYVLDPNHPKGKYKASVFRAKLGITAQQWPVLRDMILAAVLVHPATAGVRDQWGQRYAVEFPARGPGGDCHILTAWIILDGENFPRLTTCYIL